MRPGVIGVQSVPQVLAVTTGTPLVSAPWSFLQQHFALVRQHDIPAPCALGLWDAKTVRDESEKSNARHTAVKPRQLFRLRSIPGTLG